MIEETTDNRGRAPVYSPLPCAAPGGGGDDPGGDDTGMDEPPDSPGDWGFSDGAIAMEIDAHIQMLNVDSRTVIHHHEDNRTQVQHNQRPIGSLTAGSAQ